MRSVDCWSNAVPLARLTELCESENAWDQAIDLWVLRSQYRNARRADWVSEDRGVSHHPLSPNGPQPPRQGSVFKQRNRHGRYGARPWRVYVYVDGRKRYLPPCATEEEARRAFALATQAVAPE